MFSHEDLRRIPEVEPMLSQVGLPLGFIPFNVHCNTIRMYIKALIG